MALRTQLNDQAKRELIAIAEALGHTSLNHTLNLLISNSFNQIAKTQNSEVGISDVRSTATQ